MATSSPRAAVFFAEGLEECEALVVCDLFARAHISYDKVSISKELSVVSAHDLSIALDTSICDPSFSYDNYDLLFLPGGLPGTTNLGACAQLGEALVEQNKKGTLLAAVCAAPSVFAELGLLEGKHATSNPGFQDVLRAHGALVSQDEVVKDGNLITSKGLGTCIPLGLTLVGELLGASARADAAKSIVYEDVCA